MSIKSSQLIYFSLVVLLLNACGFRADAQDLTAPLPATPTALPTQSVIPPERVVEEFLRGYIKSTRQPLSERWYANSPYLSRIFVGYLDGLYQRANGNLGYDPIIMAQAVPNGFETKLYSSMEGAARVVVHEIWLNDYVDLTVDLLEEDGQWLIYSIQEGNPSTPEGVVRLFYNWYLAYSLAEGSPLDDAAYANSPYLAPALIERIQNETAGSAAGVQDPFLLASETPDEVYLYAPVIEDQYAKVIAESVWRSETAPRKIRQVQIMLENKEGGWTITNIVDPLLASAPAPISNKDGDGQEDQRFVDEDLGISFSYPSGWVVGDPYASEDNPPLFDETLLGNYLIMPLEVFEREKARWETDFPEAPTGMEWIIPYRVDVYHGDRDLVLGMYPPASFEQESVFNGFSATVRVLANGHTTQYVFAHPSRPDTWIIFNDLVSGDPAHELQARAIRGIFEHILEGLNFEE